MNFADTFKTVNWKTTGFAAGYIVCKIVGGLVPAIGPVCDVLESVAVAGGFLSAADAARVQTVVHAVDSIKENLMPPPTSTTPEPPPAPKVP